MYVDSSFRESSEKFCIDGISDTTFGILPITFKFKQV